MKRRTCVIAWMFIIVTSMALLGLIVTFVSMLSGRLRESGFSAQFAVSVFLNMAFSLLLLVCWPHLLKRHAWAWRGLVILSLLIGVKIIVFAGIVPSPVRVSFPLGFMDIVLESMLPLWILLTDKPTSWRKQYEGRVT